MSDWSRVHLADVLTLDIETVNVEPNGVYPLVGVLNRGRGLLRRDAITGRDTKYGTLNRIRPGQVVYGRLKAFEGAITVVPHDAEEAFASQEFPTFSCGNDLLPDYFTLVTTSPSLWKSLQNLSTGMGGRRERVKPADFMTLEIDLPSMQEQQRIVDAVGAVDDQIEALENEVQAGAATRGPMLESLLAAGAGRGNKTALGEVGTFVRGRRFTKDEYVESGLGCIHYGHLHTHFGSVATTTLTFLPGESQNRRRLATPGDVVVAGTSENVEDLGKATVWLGDDDVAVHDDCYIFRHDLVPRFASYLFVSPDFQKQKVQYAAGTKVTRISGANLAKIEVSIPPPDVQEIIGRALEAWDAHIDAIRSELVTLRTLRTALLASLLTRIRE